MIKNYTHHHSHHYSYRHSHHHSHLHQSIDQVGLSAFTEVHSSHRTGNDEDDGVDGDNVDDIYIL